MQNTQQADMQVFDRLALGGTTCTDTPKRECRLMATLT